MPEIDKIICDHCGHPVAIHNRFNCTYALEKENECRCPLGKETIIARHWANKEHQRALKAEKILNRKDVQNYLAWWNANRND
jgi:hypothetical protein